jgi:hypothetical protein
LGWPGNHHLDALAQQRALARPLHHLRQRCCKFDSWPARVGLAQEVDFFFRKVERGLHQHAQVDQRIAQCVDLVRERARERAAGAARRRLGAGVDQVGNRLGLRQVDLVVEKGPLGEFARLGHAQAGQGGLACGRVRLAPASRQRASSSCSTTGPPWACSSSTSSPV